MYYLYFNILYTRIVFIEFTVFLYYSWLLVKMYNFVIMIIWVNAVVCLMHWLLICDLAKHVICTHMYIYVFVCSGPWVGKTSQDSTVKSISMEEIVEELILELGFLQTWIAVTLITEPQLWYFLTPGSSLKLPPPPDHLHHLLSHMLRPIPTYSNILMSTNLCNHVWSVYDRTFVV